MTEILTYWPILVGVAALGMMWGDQVRRLKSQDARFDAHSKDMGNGFTQVTTRLDKVNGRIDQHSERLQMHGERLAKLEK